MPATEWGWLIDEPELKTWIIQEDDEILFVNKPALVVCHPSKMGPWSSLAGACREYMDLEKTFLVSRLDRETSGIVLFAKQKLVTRAHQMALERRAVTKRYFAIMEGQLPCPTLVNAPVGPDKNSLVHSKNCVKWDGKRQDAKTLFTPLHSNGRYTFVSVSPITGRKHQIRVHAQHIGHQIVGDKLYGPDETLFLDFIDDGWTDQLAKQLPLNRHALHAYQMTFHLEDGDKTYTAPLTQDLIDFCQNNLDLPETKLRKLCQHTDESNKSPEVT